MALEKLTIAVETRNRVYGVPVPVLFNPNQLRFTQDARWVPAPTAQRTAQSSYTYSAPLTLAVDLFFDTYEQGVDVSLITRQIARLLRVQGDLGRPPRCRLQWGRYNFGGFPWVLRSLSQTYTLFLSDGTPVRATLGCSFTQWIDPEEETREVPGLAGLPAVVRTRVLRQGDTLSSIAAEEYDDPGLWRSIAAMNGIDNPRRMTPGMVLSIPPRS